MALTKQAKILSKTEQYQMLSYLSGTRHPERNRVIFLLSARAGLRAKEIAALTWEMITDASGKLCDQISLPNSATKGNSGGIIWINAELKVALEAYRIVLSIARVDQRNCVIITDRNGKATPQIIVNMFQGWYRDAGFNGCSSHSGRRTFITNAARKIGSVGGSIKDVQMLARHSSLQMTQRYIDSNVEAQQKIVDLI